MALLGCGGVGTTGDAGTLDGAQDGFLDGPVSMDGAPDAADTSADVSAADSQREEDALADAAADAEADAPMRTCEADVDLGSATGVPVLTGTTEGLFDTVDPELCFGVNSFAPDLVARWVAPSTGTWTFDTFGSSFDTLLYVLDPTCTELACSDDKGLVLASRLDLDLSEGEELLVVVDAHRNTVGSVVLNVSPPPVPEMQCADEVDNDRDGATDCDESLCRVIAPEDCLESLCDDGLDNDGDGVADCLDLDCYFAVGCYEQGCSDGVDDDGDGFVDCEDPDCAEVEPCAETSCADGTDNDDDGIVDCEDVDCLCDTECTPDSCPDFDLGMAVGSAVAEGDADTGCDFRHHTGPCLYGQSGGNDVTFRWTAPDDGVYRFDTFGSNYDTTLYVRDGSCSGPELACNGDNDGTDQLSLVELPLVAGQVVVIVIDAAYPGTEATYRLNIAAL